MQSTEYQFQKTGNYVYSDPYNGNSNGIIHVLAKYADNHGPDHTVTDPNYKTIGIFIAPFSIKQYYDDFFNANGYKILSTSILGDHSNYNRVTLNSEASIMYLWSNIAMDYNSILPIPGLPESKS
jgi:hypothetical protein